MSSDKPSTPSILAIVLIALVSGVAYGSCVLPDAFLRTSPEFSASKAGIEIWKAAPGDAGIESLTLLRLNSHQWKPRVFDVREVSTLLAKRQQFQTPRYTVAEALTLQSGDTIVATAGFTQTLNAPVPAGLLVVNKVEHAPAFRLSRIMDGHVCIPTNGAIEVLSEVEKAARRVPANANRCRDAVQAGPVLVFDGESQITPKQLLTARVALAVDKQGRYLLAYSPKATTYALACALALPALGIRTAINLQGDAYGGIALSSGLAEKVGTQTLGSTGATVASLLIFSSSESSNTRSTQSYVAPPPAKAQVRSIRPPVSSVDRVIGCGEKANTKCR